jgi:hypothetical protein
MAVFGQICPAIRAYSVVLVVALSTPSSLWIQTTTEKIRGQSWQREKRENAGRGDDSFSEKEINYRSHNH